MGKNKNILYGFLMSLKINKMIDGFEYVAGGFNIIKGEHTFFITEEID